MSGSRMPFDDSATIGGFIAFPLVPTGFIRFVLCFERADEVDLTIPSVENLNEVSHFFPFLFSSLFSYIDIIQSILELSSKFWKFYCQEILTKLFSIFRTIGTELATAIFMPKKLFLIWHSICYGKIDKILEKLVISPYRISTYIKFSGIDIT
jgi:hypothetical protein